MVAFLDIKGAFDNASYSSMRSAMEAMGLDNCIIEWITANSQIEKILLNSEVRNYYIAEGLSSRSSTINLIAVF